MGSAIKTIRIAPSILSADFSRLGEEIQSVLDGGADLLHLDVMDGHFVGEITFGPPLVKSVRGAAPQAVLDCHLMITDPAEYVGAFCDAGADWVSVHVEARAPAAALRVIRLMGKRAGIVLNPDTPLDRARPLLPLTSYVLIMSVFPGRSGQKFIPHVLDKVRALRAEGYAGEIEIDGGINAETARLAIEAGAEVLVAGNAVFKQQDRGAAIRALRGGT